MTVNQYFNFNFQNEDQKLIEDLIIENIQISGIDLYYLPRQYNSPDKLYGEDNCATFNKAIMIEMYIKSALGFEGQDYLSKFGLQIQEQGKLTLSMKRFREITGLERPYEKDLIYIPSVISDSLYEITFVEHESIFHQMGKLQVWDLDIDLFSYSNQRIQTGVAMIDKFSDLFSHSIRLEMAAGGTAKYQYGEIVYQGASLAAAIGRATVIQFKPSSRELYVKDVWGDFNNTSPIIGQTSGASWTIHAVDEAELPNSVIADNKEINDIGTTLVDWSEKNPFGN